VRYLALLLAGLPMACAAGRPAGMPALTPRVEPISVALALRSIAPWRIDVAPDRRMTVCAGGDVMLGSNLDPSWLRRAQEITGSPTPMPDPSELLAPLEPLVADADVVLVNVEGAIGEGPAPAKCRPGSQRCYAFRQDPSAARALRNLAPHAAVVGNVANNHAMDAGAPGLVQTAQHLSRAGVHVVGLDTLPTLIPLPAGDTLAVLGFSVFSAGPDARDLTAVARHVRRAARHHARVVVSMHVGAEGVGAQRTSAVTERFAGEDRGNPVAIAHTAIDAGADLVIGHGPHVLRAVEWRGAGLVAYSLGNLLTYGPFSRVPPLDRGTLLCAVLEPYGGIAQADLRATHQVAPGRAYPDTSHAAFSLVDSLGALDFPATAASVFAGMLRRPSGAR